MTKALQILLMVGTFVIAIALLLVTFDIVRFNSCFKSGAGSPEDMEKARAAKAKKRDDKTKWTEEEVDEHLDQILKDQEDDKA